MRKDINIVVTTPEFEENKDLLEPLFDGEEFEEVPPGWDMFDLLKHIEFFPSKGQARKNWHGPAEIPEGFSLFEFGKRKHLLTIWKPKGEA